MEDKESLGSLPRKWLQYLEEIIECLSFSSQGERRKNYKKKLQRNTRQLPVTAKTTEFVVQILIAGLIS